MTYKEIDGDLIKLALQGEFDVIAHGCNCYCIMGAGIAVEMKNTFECNTFPLEDMEYKGDVNKLGQIDYDTFTLSKHDLGETKLFSHSKVRNQFKQWTDLKTFSVVNAYTQCRYGTSGGAPVDYEAITLCMRKMNYIFAGKHIGLPKIGCGLAGGNWDIIKEIIQEELQNCDVTIVNYKK